jgi:hypothetical protein
VLGDALYRIPLWLLSTMALAAYTGAIELGFRCGHRERERERDEPQAHSHLSTLQSAVLSLLALLLAFSFAMAEGRYDKRRQLVLAESNAIGTAVLRTSLLAEPERSELRALFRRYVDDRIELHAAGPALARHDAAIADSERLQAAMWDSATRASAHTSNEIASGLFLRALNDVIDLHSERVVALENRVPRTIVSLIFLVGVIAAALVGYGCGLDGARKFWLTSLAAIVFVSVGTTVLDLDRPYRGFIKVPQQSMLRLRQSLRTQ